MTQEGLPGGFRAPRGHEEQNSALPSLSPKALARSSQPAEPGSPLDRRRGGGWRPRFREGGGEGRAGRAHAIPGAGPDGPVGGARLCLSRMHSETTLPQACGGGGVGSGVGRPRQGPREHPDSHVVGVFDELHHVAGIVRQLPDRRLGDDLGEFLLGQETRPVSAGALGPQKPRRPWSS